MSYRGKRGLQRRGRGLQRGWGLRRRGGGFTGGEGFGRGWGGGSRCLEARQPRLLAQVHLLERCWGREEGEMERGEEEIVEEEGEGGRKGLKWT